MYKEIKKIQILKTVEKANYNYRNDNNFLKKK
jgi:hypothetical protein